MSAARAVRLVLLASLCACTIKHPPPPQAPPDAQLEARLADGMRNFAEGDPNWAIAAADDVLRWKPDHPGARELRTRCLIGLGRADEAADEALEGVRVTPRKLAPWILYAEALAAAGRRADAVEALDAAIALAPAAGAPRIALSRIAESVGELAHAEAILKKAVEIAPANDGSAAAALAAFVERRSPDASTQEAGDAGPDAGGEKKKDTKKSKKGRGKNSRKASGGGAGGTP